MSESKKEPLEITEQQALIVSDKPLPSVIHLQPIISRPFFPGQVIPLLMEQKHWRATYKAVGETDEKIIGLVWSEAVSSEKSTPADLHQIGTACRILQVKDADNELQVLVEGIQRFKVTRNVTKRPPLVAQVEYIEDLDHSGDDEIKAYAMAVINTIKELLPLNPLYVEEFRLFLDRFGPDDPTLLVDFAATLTTAKAEKLQAVLAELDIKKRMRKVLTLLSKELEIAKAQQKIRQSVEDNMDEQQREFFLREQLKVIQQELGLEKDGRTSEVDEFETRLKKLTLTEQAQKRLDNELDKFALLEPSSSEYALTHGYLDLITTLPWGIYSKDNLNLKKARKALNKHHYGLDDVKQRILEFLAVGINKGEVAGSIILLIGPPGVGKTSIGKSVASALKRKFYRFSVGGMRDEAEIKGHRRTYVGAMPGKFIQALQEVGTQNPVIMLDEIDKIGNSFQGDPASALLEALDPEQNSEYLDHYLDLRFDLSKALFICTANQLDTIPAPLLDRMETISLSGYIGEERLQIAKKYLVPRQLKKTGLTPQQIKINSPTLRQIIENYARDAGVRRLEKQISKIMRKATLKILEGAITPIQIQPKKLAPWLGTAVFQDERKITGPGIVTGLAWTAMGGATLSIEVVVTHRLTRGFKLTGQLGDVMKESAEIAYGYVISHATEFGIAPDFFKDAFIHLHVPAGATPKDGPSAGITIASALVSLALNKRIRDIAMTGELTLTGEVFPVGGIQEKMVAARRLGIKELIVPKENKGEYDEVPEYIRKGIKIHFASQFTEVMKHLF